MTDEPQEILRDAGVECAELEKFYRDYHYFRQKDVPWSALDAIEALARLVAKYKWQLDNIFTEATEVGKAEGFYFHESVEANLADLNRRWVEHDPTG